MTKTQLVFLATISENKKDCLFHEAIFLFIKNSFLPFNLSNY